MSFLLALALLIPPGARFEVVNACQGMDLVTPPGASTVVLYLHGGAFEYGDRRSDIQLEWYGPSLRDRGFAVASADYRFGPWPTPYEDAECAARYLASRFDHVLAIGGSAGGTLAAMLAVRDRLVERVVALSGPMRLDGLWWLRREWFPDIADASPETWLDPDDPPVLVILGSEDTQVPPDSARSFDHRVIEGYGHGLSGEPWLVALVMDYLSRAGRR